MSMMFFVQPDCPFRFAHQDDHRIKGLNAETIARILLPPPSWLLTADYAPLRSDAGDSPTSIFFSLNLSIYGQPLVASEWTEEWFFMNGRVHPYALAWEVEQYDGLESDSGSALHYTMPALIVRDQGYQPVLPRLLASMEDFPCVPPVVSFTGPVAGPGQSLLRQDLLPGLDATQLKCCGFIRLSTYLTPGDPDRTPFKGFHPFQVFVIFPIHANPWAILCKKMAERRDSQFQANIHFTCTGKVAGLLDHRLMVQPPGSDRDYVFIVVPDSWTFLDKATTTAATSALPLATPPKRPTSSAAEAFRSMRAASLNVGFRQPVYAAMEAPVS
ncbi:complex I intermediate-associated protein 30 [Purpureocillium lavendulum]|uniref:ATP-dependent DNA helicase pfh1 n=1 Tax=Purpureocillium lavendulum TaxID=1247861 RepID=A0AB34FFX5_9HYPO|nr:ATP-dependent DNA helicase pfh1 [Purpureocillium lavendulum]KAJ6437550.1 helix-loop-helix DNA-binding domain-containing protein [Purpureocillium lavendulum]KAJ6437584.1 complex I intermediate-associated protein 30 [Purpureocillium lavendulum]